MGNQASSQQLTAKDFTSDQRVRWCPGCGDYSILSQVQKVLPTLGIPKENFVFVSGIGCSSRFPYYMNTYGFHSIHGRAPTLATGIKSANPQLEVWVVTGDGDGLSIGGNHLLHTLRRNVDLKILLFNNRIYGLTKGQYSPTSEFGKKTKTSPYGSIDNPINPLAVALASEATFIARGVDTDAKNLTPLLQRMAQHKGAAFVEIFQNCVIFNDDAFAYETDRETKEDHILILEHGKPLVFGKNRDKGIRLNGIKPEVVTLGNGVSEADLLVHDEEGEDPFYANMLVRLGPPHFPTPLGVMRSIRKPTYEFMLEEQIADVKKKKGVGSLEGLLTDGDVWEVK